MGLLENILGSTGGNATEALAKKFDLSGGQIQSALKELVPQISGGIKKNASADGGLGNLMNAIKTGGHEKYLDDANELTAESTQSQGNKILGHIFGDKEVSRQVAAGAAQKTGLDAGVLKKLLPYAAAMSMGSLSKNKSQVEAGDAGMLGKFLDKDGDGSIMDDVMGMAKKIF